MILSKLYEIILDRKEKMPSNSYTASLFREGKDRILQKVGEEAIEVIIAAKKEDRKEVIYEIADLWFHLLILMVIYKINIQDIYLELSKRRERS